MPRQNLPPPPESPERPPAFAVNGERRLRLRTVDGQSLEALARFPPGAGRVVVLCHPHPLYGGTMHNAVIISMAKALLDAAKDDVATLRFNFRGVEDSSGSFDNGNGETLDVIAAVDAVLQQAPGARITVLGYSFGSWVALRAAWQHDEIERIALVAPAVRLLDYEIENRSKRHIPAEVLVGDRDDLVPVSDARELAEWIGAQLHIIDDADHFFVRQRRLVAQTLLPFIAPELF